jgi:O-antigen/teichoic acid export membrane protein
VSTLLTAKWLPVIVPLQLLCLVSWFRGIVSLNSPLVIAKGRPRIVIHNFLLQAIVMPACFFIGSKWGLLGVSLAWVLAWPFLAFLITWQTLQLIELRVQDYARALVQPLLGSAAMVVVVMFMRWNVVTGAPNIVRLVALCVTGGAVYAGYMMLFNKGAITDAIEILKSARSTRDAGRVAATSVPAAAGATTSGGAA